MSGLQFVLAFYVGVFEPGDGTPTETTTVGCTPASAGLVDNSLGGMVKKDHP